MQVLDAADTGALLPARALIDAVGAAMRARRAGTLHAPERLALPLPGDGRFLAMPAADGTLAIAKLVSVHPEQAALGQPTIQGRVLVTDARSGEALMLLDGPTVTARRTAAVTAVGLQALRPAPAATPLPRAPGAIALLGTGAQAEAHARFLVEAGLAHALHLIGRDRTKADALAGRLAAVLPAGVAVSTHADVGEALRRAGAIDALVTLTTALSPVLPDGLPAQLLVVGVGAFRPHMAELPARLLHERGLIVDDLPGARAEAGDLLRAGVDWSRVTELVDHLDSAPPPGAAPILKTVGQAAWDLAAAHVARRMLDPD